MLSWHIAAHACSVADFANNRFEQSGDHRAALFVASASTVVSLAAELPSTTDVSEYGVEAASNVVATGRTFCAGILV